MTNNVVDGCGFYQQLYALELGQSTISEYIQQVKKIISNLEAQCEVPSDRAVIAAVLNGLPDKEIFRRFKHSWALQSCVNSSEKLFIKLRFEEKRYEMERNKMVHNECVEDICRLYQELHTLKLGESISEYIQQIEKIIHNLKTQCEVPSDRAVIAAVLKGLPDEEMFRTFKLSWIISENLNLKNLFTELLAEENRYQEFKFNKLLSANPWLVSSDGKPWQSQKSQDNQNAEEKEQDQPNKSECLNCDEKNKQKEDNEASSSSCVTDTNDTESSVLDSEWIIDYNANFHIAKERSVFWTLDESNGGETIFLKNNGSLREIQSKGIGQIKIESCVDDNWSEYILTEVRWMPDAEENRFALRAARVLGCHFTLTCKITDKYPYQLKLMKEHKTIMTGKRNENCNSFQVQFRVKKPVQTRGPARVSLKSLHERMAHANVETLIKIILNESVIINKNLKVDLFSCEACDYGNQKPASFNPEVGDNLEVGDHLEVGDVVYCCLSDFQTPAIDGSRYFMVFKDDKSDYRIVYTLQDINMIESNVLSYCRQAEYILRRKVKVVKINDNCGFDKKPIEAILKQQDIELAVCNPKQESCDVQNKAEQEINMLSESATAMLRGCNVPNSLWSEAVKMAAWIKNRISTPEHENKTSFELWHGNKPNIERTRMFGSICRDIYQTEKQIFVGYESYQSHYINFQLYNPITYEITTTMHVIFDEDENQI